MEEERMTQFGDKLIDRLVSFCYGPDMTGEEYRKMLKWLRRPWTRPPWQKGRRK